jgi:hypothetical protein
LASLESDQLPVNEQRNRFGYYANTVHSNYIQECILQKSDYYLMNEQLVVVSVYLSLRPRYDVFNRECERTYLKETKSSHLPDVRYPRFE